MSERSRIRIRRGDRPTEQQWATLTRSFSDALRLQLDVFAHIPAEEKPGGLVVLRLRIGIYSPRDVASFAARLRFAFVGSTGLPQSRTAPYIVHLLGREDALRAIQPRVASWQVGGPGWVLLPRIVSIDDQAAYAYPTDFPGQFVAHVYHQVPGWHEALSHVVARLGGAVTAGCRDPASATAGMLPVTVDPNRFEELLQFPLLHSVQGQHRLRLSTAS